MSIKLPVQSPDGEAVVLHFGGDCKLATFKSPNVCEVPDGATARGEKLSVVGRVGKMAAFFFLRLPCGQYGPVSKLSWSSL